ncbi:MAG: YcjX family protein [Neomegalonema sp.]|nr:YcjX family protein [Neomegalonema sp.]
MAISEWADGAARMMERWSTQAAGMLQPSLRLGVTGLSRAGKTLFITSLVANLLRRGRMPGLKAEAEGRILAAMLTPQPDFDAPRFDFERHLSDLYGSPPTWPESTRQIAQLRVSLRYQSSGMMGRLAREVVGDSYLNLDIIDYPGEWLLDLALMEKDFASWSNEALTAAKARAQGEGAEAVAGRAFLNWVAGTDFAAPLDEAAAQQGAALYAEFLRAMRQAGFSRLAPGRFLLPGDLEGAPALTFAPAPPERTARRGSLRATLAQRYEAYKALVVRPFFTTHFAKLDRQIVLVDALGAAGAGPAQTEDMALALRDIMSAFRPGERSWLGALLGPLWPRRIDRVLLAASKADHIHHSAHPALMELINSLLAETVDRAAYRGAAVNALAIASVRATVEDEIRHNGELLPAVRGRLAESGEDAALFAGSPPRSLAALKSEDWSRDCFQSVAFAPPILEAREGEGPPHIRIDKALDFLVGDRL